MAIGGIVSRRAALAGGGAALLLRRALAGEAPPVPIQGEADDASRLTILTRIDGKGPFRFMVDTGADRTVVADDVAALFGPADAGPELVQGIISAMPSGSVRLKNLTFGRVTLDRLRAPVLPRAMLGTDGYLGLDALDDRRVTFDFGRRTLAVSDALSRWLPEHLRYDETAVRVSGDSGRLVSVDSRVDSVRVAAFIDSGAEISIANTALHAALRETTGRDYPPDPAIDIRGVTGGVAQGLPIAVGRIDLGHVVFAGGTLVVSDLPIFGVWGLADKPAMLIGMNLLTRTAAMTIDYGRQEVLFRVAQTRVASRA